MRDNIAAILVEFAVPVNRASITAGMDYNLVAVYQVATDDASKTSDSDTYFPAGFQGWYRSFFTGKAPCSG